MNKLIMNFFIFEGYREAAIQFQKETQQESNPSILHSLVTEQELDSMSERIEVKKYILNGQID